MGKEYPPQKFCDKCEMPDYEYPYCSYTGQIDQVTRVTLSETQYNDNSDGSRKVGLDFGYLCQECRQKLYEEVINLLLTKHDKYKDYPKRIDEYSKQFTSGEGKPVKGWWERKIEIRSHTNKILKDGKFVDQ